MKRLNLGEVAALGGISGCIVLVVFMIVFMPLAAIWSVNTLFAFGIPFTIKTWFAALSWSSSSYPPCYPSAFRTV